VAPNKAKFIENFIERLLLNAINDARTGNFDEMVEAV
jgi:hypothetical protein